MTWRMLHKIRLMVKSYACEINFFYGQQINMFNYLDYSKFQYFLIVIVA